MGAGKLYDIGFVSSQTISGGTILSNNLTVGSVSNTEFGYLDGVTSAIQTQLDTKASISNYIASTTALSLFAGSANINRTYVDTISGNSLDKYYPSSLGRGVSGAVYPLTEWFIESGEKLSTISGSLSDRIAALEGASEITWLSLETVSSNAISAYNWTSTSGSILPYPSSIGAGTSGTVASLVLFSSNSRSLYYPSALGKGVSGQLNAHTSDATIHFTKESLDDDYAGSSNINRALLDAISGNLDTRIDAISFNPENYITSSNALEIFAHSTNINSRFRDSSNLWTFVSSSRLYSLDIYTDNVSHYANNFTTYSFDSLGLFHKASGVSIFRTDYIDTRSGSITINFEGANEEGPENVDFIVLGYNTYGLPSLFKVDAGLNKVGVGVDSPGYKLEVSGGVYGNSISSQTISGGAIIGNWAGEPLTSAYITDYIASAGALDKFAGSSVTSLTNKWFIESGEKLSTISGGLSSRINAVTGLNGATASTNFFLATSGNTLWSWYSISASKLSESGNKYSDVYSWYNASASKLSESGSKYSNNYSWYNESAQKLSDISGNLRANFMFSSIALSLFAHSTNINDRFVVSSLSLSRYNEYIGHSGSVNRHLPDPVSDGNILKIADGNWGEATFDISLDTDPYLGGNLDGNSFGINELVFLSSQTLSGQLLNLHSARDINSWDPIAWHNSSLMWNNDLSKWIPKPSGVAAVGGGIENVVEDTTPQLGGDLDGQSTYGINNLTYLSSQYISAGTIIGTWNGDPLTYEYITGYIASSEAILRFADSSNINSRFVGSSSALDKYMQSSVALSIFAHSTNINERFKASSGTWEYASSNIIYSPTIYGGDVYYRNDNTTAYGFGDNGIGGSYGSVGIFLAGVYSESQKAFIVNPYGASDSEATDVDLVVMSYNSDIIALFVDAGLKRVGINLTNSETIPLYTLDVNGGIYGNSISSQTISGGAIGTHVLKGYNHYDILFSGGVDDSLIKLCSSYGGPGRIEMGYFKDPEDDGATRVYGPFRILLNYETPSTPYFTFNGYQIKIGPHDYGTNTGYLLDVSGSTYSHSISSQTISGGVLKSNTIIGSNDDAFKLDSINKVYSFSGSSYTSGNVIFKAALVGNYLTYDVDHGDSSDGSLVLHYKSSQKRDWDKVMPGFIMTDGTYECGLLRNFEHEKSGLRLDMGWGGANGGNFELYHKFNSERPGEFRITYGGGNFGHVPFIHYNGSTWNTKGGVNENGRWAFGVSSSYFPGKSTSPIIALEHPVEIFGENERRQVYVSVDGEIHTSGGVSSLYLSSQTASGGSFKTNSIVYNKTPFSGGVMTSIDSIGTVSWKYPPITVSQANVSLCSGQYLDLFRQNIGNKDIYIWQAGINDSGGKMAGDLCLEVRSGSTRIFMTSSSFVQGNPLARLCSGGNIQIRMMYSSASGYGMEIYPVIYGNAFCNFSVYD